MSVLFWAGLAASVLLFMAAWAGSRALTRKARYRAYLHSPHWKATRLARLRLDGFQCQECGARRHLEVHHLSYRNLGKEPLDDLRTLCARCHQRAHGR